MEKALLDAVLFHAFLMGLGPVIFVVNLLFLFGLKNYATLNKWLYTTMVMVFMWVAMGFFSGVFILAMQGFSLSWKVGLMILTLGIVMGGEIWRTKKLKRARTQESLMLGYIRWCCILYGLDLLLCGLIFSLKDM